MKRLTTLLALLLAVTACDRGIQPAFVNHSAPDFAVQDAGRTVALSSLRGKVVVLNFWATWCPPCVEEMPSLVAMQHQMRDTVIVFAVSVDTDEPTYRRFLEQYHAQELLAVRDPEQKGALLYGTTGYPESYIIDRQGTVLRKLVGPVDWTSPEMLGYLRQVAGTTTASPSAVAANSR